MTEIDKVQQQKEDIDSIYSQIEADILKSTDLKRSMSSLSSHSAISSSSSSSSNSSDYKSIHSEEEEQQESSHTTTTPCSCKDIIVSIDSQHCGLCDQVIPPLQQHQQERLQELGKIEKLKAEVAEKQAQYQLNQKELNSLQTKYTNAQQAVIEMTDKITSLTGDIEIVQLKHKDEIAHTIEIEHSKKLVEIELHDLTQKLFEEANRIVLVEKEEKLAIQLQHDKVDNELTEAEWKLKNVQLELDQLRKDMTEKDEELNFPSSQPQSSRSSFITTHENYLLRAQLDMSSLLKDDTPEPIEINDDYHQQVHDNTLLTEFQQFMDSIQSVSLSKLSTLPFMKLCMKTDIEPCLRFGPSPKISAKKITDAILVKTCLVEECPPSFLEEKIKALTARVEPVKVRTSLWDRFSSSSSNTTTTNTTNSQGGMTLACQACGRSIDEKYDCWRFRISYFDEWSLIDRYCYDRIASVIEFYTFLRKLKIGAYNHVELFQVYQDCSKLKLQMFLSR